MGPPRGRKSLGTRLGSVEIICTFVKTNDTSLQVMAFTWVAGVYACVAGELVLKDDRKRPP